MLSAAKRRNHIQRGSHLHCASESQPLAWQSDERVQLWQFLTCCFKAVKLEQPSGTLNNSMATLNIDLWFMATLNNRVALAGARHIHRNYSLHRCHSSPLRNVVHFCKASNSLCREISHPTWRWKFYIFLPPKCPTKKKKLDPSSETSWARFTPYSDKLHTFFLHTHTGHQTNDQDLIAVQKPTRQHSLLCVSHRKKSFRPCLSLLFSTWLNFTNCL